MMSNIGHPIESEQSHGCRSAAQLRRWIVWIKFNGDAIRSRIRQPQRRQYLPGCKTRKASGEANVKNKNLGSMSADELWVFREEIHSTLSRKLDAEKREIERRLARLNGSIGHEKKVRRPYPKVHPKYRNPERPSETWSGRGRQPRWVEAQLSSGMLVDDFLIPRTH